MTVMTSYHDDFWGQKECSSLQNLKISHWTVFETGPGRHCLRTFDFGNRSPRHVITSSSSFSLIPRTPLTMSFIHEHNKIAVIPPHCHTQTNECSGRAQHKERIWVDLRLISNRSDIKLKPTRIAASVLERNVPTPWIVMITMSHNQRAKLALLNSMN